MAEVLSMYEYMLRGRGRSKDGGVLNQGSRAMSRHSSVCVINTAEKGLPILYCKAGNFRCLNSYAKSSLANHEITISQMVGNNHCSHETCRFHSPHRAYRFEAS